MSASNAANAHQYLIGGNADVASLKAFRDSQGGAEFGDDDESSSTSTTTSSSDENGANEEAADEVSEMPSFESLFSAVEDTGDEPQKGLFAFHSTASICSHLIRFQNSRPDSSKATGSPTKVPKRPNTADLATSSSHSRR